MTLSDWSFEHNVCFKGDNGRKWFKTRPDGLMSDDKKYPMDHWRVILTDGSSDHVVWFSMGLGHKGKKPELEDILNALASDCSCVAWGQSFEEFCSELGYDNDSRKAEKIYNACLAEYNGLVDWLGKGAIESLIECERL